MGFLIQKTYATHMNLVGVVNEMGSIERIAVNIIIAVGKIFFRPTSIYFWGLHFCLCWTSYSVAKKNRYRINADTKLPLGLKQILFLGIPNRFTEKHIKIQKVIVSLGIIMGIVFLVDDSGEIRALYSLFYFIMFCILYLKLIKL